MGSKSTKVIFQRFSHGYRAEAIRISVPWNILVENLPNHFPRSFWKHLPEGFEPCYYRNNDDPLNLGEYHGMTIEEAFKVEGFNDSIHPLTFSVRFLPIPRQEPVQVEPSPLASVRSPFQRSSTEQKLAHLAHQLRGPNLRSSTSSDDSLPLHDSDPAPFFRAYSNKPKEIKVELFPREVKVELFPREVKVELLLYVHDVRINSLTVIKDGRKKLDSLKKTAQRSFGLGSGTIALIPLTLVYYPDANSMALGYLATDNSLSAKVEYFPDGFSDPIYSHRAYIDAMKWIDAMDEELSVIAKKSNGAILPDGPKDRLAKDNEEACAVCMDNVIQICIVPCGHHAFCISCADKLDICSICRGRIELRQRVFKP